MRFNPQVDPVLKDLLHEEIERQQTTLSMIPSENCLSSAVIKLLGNVFNNKYAEGYPGNRYYQGCGVADKVESLAIERAKAAFGAEHANVQPHSGSGANMAAYFALLNDGDTIMAMDLKQGGHLTHGSKVNFSGKVYNVVHYSVDPKTEQIDYDQMLQLARETKPRMIVTGATAYPRTIHFDKWQAIADEVGAYHLADISHIAGLVAAGVHPSPVPYADVVTFTTHKTLAGPRGAVILCKAKYADAIDKAVFPGLQGGPLMHVIAAKAAVLGEVTTPAFRGYQQAIVENARALADELLRRGYRLISGGTDNHLILLDLRPLDLTGKVVAAALEEAGIVLNMNTIPFDPKGPKTTSGIRFGTPILTNRGMGPAEMVQIADMMDRVIKNYDNAAIKAQVRQEVKELCARYPIYTDLQI
ncbi:MAG TPA: serine hydroxymethyltransferase [Firmicutes bacterium]|jgi:glycine hydroxymethyltransferase|nr:serine hydroxymethyltransferase [Bacillota bacterium]HOQ23126.1 serine hydroxymethyltransferase [Bacillota bacterium]HPT67023.1 serine hydroxymethyltransferase [Bacillota bacterium]